MAVAKQAAIVESTPITTPKPGNTKEVESLIQKYRDTEDQLEADLTTLRQQLTEMEALSGKRVLDARISGNDKVLAKVSAELSDIRTKIEALESALYPCWIARQAAEKDLKLSQAADMRNRAAEIRKEAGERKKKTKDLLGQLAVHEDVGYVPRGASRTQMLLNKAHELESEAMRAEAWANATPQVIRKPGS